MWLRNWYNLLNQAINGEIPYETGQTSITNKTVMRNLQGNYYPAKNVTNNIRPLQFGTSGTNAGISQASLSALLLGVMFNPDTAIIQLWLGETSDSVVTLDDYSENYTSYANFTSLSFTEVLHEGTNSNIRSKMKFQGLYNGSATINVNCVSLRSAYGSACVLYKEILATPFTLASGDSIILELQRDFVPLDPPTP